MAKGKSLGTRKPSGAKDGNKKKGSNDAQEGRSVRPQERPFTIYSMKEKKKQRYLKGIAYGEYGVGKTTLAASAEYIPEMKDVFFISVEAGEMSIEFHDEIDVVEPKTFQEFSKMHQFLRNHCKLRDSEREKDIKKMLKLEQFLKGDDTIEKPRRYRTVVIDSLSEVQKLSMYQLLGINLKNYTLDVEPQRPEYAEWNTSTELIRLLIRLFRNLPMNVIAVCGPRIDENERKQRIYSPGLSKALSKEIQGFVDFVGFLVSGKVEGQTKRRLWLEPGDTYAAKNRFPEFEGEYLDSPEMKDLWSLLR